MREKNCGGVMFHETDRPKILPKHKTEERTIVPVAV